MIYFFTATYHQGATNVTSFQGRLKEKSKLNHLHI